jgi:predicted metal-dependent hydrolase
MRLSGRDFGGAISTTPYPLPIRRDLKWDFSDIEFRFVDDDILVSYAWAALSILTPATERFFVTALRPLISSVDNAKLRQDMEDMLTQEAMHAAAHARFNRALARKGYPVDRAEPHVEAMLTWISDNCSQMDMVAMVAFGEHLFHSLARTFLGDTSIGAAMAPGFRRLLEYHMLEEVEHAAVAQDVLKYFLCGDDYVHRARISAMAMQQVMSALTGIMNELVVHGPEGITWKNRARFSSYALAEPGVLRLTGCRIAAYVRPDYDLQFEPEDARLRAHFGAGL